MHDQLKRACTECHLNALAYLLFEFDVDFLHVDDIDKSTSLILCAKSGFTDGVVVLLDLCRCKYPNLLASWLAHEDCDGLTAMQYSVLCRHVEVVSVLSYFDPKFWTSSHHRDVLNLAIKVGSDQIVTLIVHYYGAAEPHKRDPSGRQHSWRLKKCFFRLYEYLQNKDFVGFRKHVSMVTYFLSCTSMLGAFAYSVMLARKEFFAAPSHLQLLHIAVIASQMIVWLVMIRIFKSNPGLLPGMGMPESSTWSKRGRSDVPNRSKDLSSFPHTTIRSYEDAIRSIVKRARTQTTSPRSTAFRCHLCRVYRPFRCGHSRFLNRCVPAYDHFCPYLWADIGRDNYGLFIAALVSMSVFAMPLFFVDAIVYVAAQLDYQKQHSLPSLEIFPLLDAFLCWTAIMWLLITCVLLFHLWLMAKALTTKEVVGGGEKFSYLDGGVNLFSRSSAWENVLSRMWPCDGDVCYSAGDVRRLLERTRTHYHLCSALRRLWSSSSFASISSCSLSNVVKTVAKVFLSLASRCRRGCRYGHGLLHGFLGRESGNDGGDGEEGAAQQQERAAYTHV